MTKKSMRSSKASRRAGTRRSKASRRAGSRRAGARYSRKSLTGGGYPPYPFVGNNPGGSGGE